MTFNAYLFDLYGTLVDIRTDESALALWRDLAAYMASRGAVWEAETLHFSYLAQVQAREHAMQSANPRPSFCPEIDLADVFRSLYAEKGVAADMHCVAETAWHFRRTSTKHIRLYAGAKALLAACKRRGRVILLSNAQSLFTVPELWMLGIRDVFDAIFISSECGMKKPDPQFFRMAAERFSLDPSRCLMIGNDPDCDVIGAMHAGFAACYIHSNISPQNAPPACEGAAYNLSRMDLKRLQTMLFPKRR